MWKNLLNMKGCILKSLPASPTPRGEPCLIDPGIIWRPSSYSHTSQLMNNHMKSGFMMSALFRTYLIPRDCSILVHNFLWLHSTPLCDFITICLLIILLADTWFIFPFFHILKQFQDYRKMSRKQSSHVKPPLSPVITVLHQWGTFATIGEPTLMCYS